MANVKIQGNASGSGVLTITAPNTDATRTITLPDSTGTIQTVDGESYSPRGLICSNDSDAAHDVAISVGGVKDATNTVNITLAAILTKRIDAAWAVGDNNGGLDGTESSGGTPDASTMYYIWLIKRSDTGVVDALYSESPTGPTMPTNYDYKRLIGAVYTNGSANITAFVNRGMNFMYTASPIVDINDTSLTGDTEETGTLSVPPSSIAWVYAQGSNTGSSQTLGRFLLYNADQTLATGVGNSWLAIGTAGTFDHATTAGQITVNASSQVKYEQNEDSGTASIIVSTYGFTMLTRNDP